MTRNKLLMSLAAAVCLFIIFSSTASARIDLSPDGPYPVGVRMQHLDYEGKKMPTLIWYPAKPSPGATPYDYLGQVKGTAMMDAALDDAAAPYPLILFSHGMGGCGNQSVFYTENLASHGYVVIAPDHADAAMCHIDREPDVTVGKIVWSALKAGFDLGKTVFNLFGERFRDTGFDFSYRPAEAKAVVDQALAWNRDSGSFLCGKIDPERIGVSGHSLGGYTSLMVGGVPFLCDQPEDQDPKNCDFDNLALDHAPNPCCLEYVREADPFQARDPRIKAMLPLGPAVFFPHLERAAAMIEIPVMIITGDDENMEVPLEPIKIFYDNSPAPKYLVVLKKTDHMAITDVAFNIPAARIALPGFRRGFQDKAQAYKDYSAEFFRVYLKGEGKPSVLVRKNPYVMFWGEE